MTIQLLERPRSQLRTDGASDLACLPGLERDTSIDDLATKLMDLCSGSHSVAMVYRFLLRAQDHTEEPPWRNL
jgi:hypothetical protein